MGQGLADDQLPIPLRGRVHCDPGLGGLEGERQDHCTPGIPKDCHVRRHEVAGRAREDWTAFQVWVQGLPQGQRSHHSFWAGSHADVREPEPREEHRAGQGVELDGQPQAWVYHFTGPSPDFQTVGDAQFSVKNKGDEMKNRGKAGLTLNKWDGSQWQGNINKLLTGEGYEIKVENAVTVTFGN